MQAAAISWRSNTIVDLQTLNKEAAEKTKIESTTPKPNIKFVDNGYNCFR